jgi:hypothetical protein
VKKKQKIGNELKLLPLQQTGVAELEGRTVKPKTAEQ